MNTTKVGYVLALLLLPLLAACSPATSEPATTATEAATAAPPTAIFTPEPTAAPTEIPLLEVTFEQLSQMDRSLGSFTQDDAGNLLYSSPLQSAVGKNVEFIQEERTIGLGGGPETWFSPAEHPNAPAVIYDRLTDEFRRGPFGYIEINKDGYTFIKRGEYGGGISTLDFLVGKKISNNFVELIQKDNATMYAVSVFPQEEFSLENKDGYFSLLVATPIDSSGSSYSLIYRVILFPYEKDPAYKGYLSLYNNKIPEQGFALSEDNGIEPLRTDEEYRRKAIIYFRDTWRTGSQSLVYGMREAPSREDIPREAGSQHYFLSQYRLSYDKSEQMDILFRILESGALPEDLTKVGESLKLFGLAAWYYDE
ncbi:MAG: hypothetical protein KF698_05915 [Anaerolineales bacterium]|nr:hypothetical protein [Anaerolineales bacterium]